jgi:hypothetical protein
LAKLIIEKFFELKMYRFIEGEEWKIGMLFDYQVKGFLKEWELIFPRLLKTDCISLLLRNFSVI